MKITSAGSLMMWVVAVAIVLTFIFHQAYQYTELSAPLETVIVLAAFIIVFAFRFVAHAVGKRRRDAGPPGPGSGVRGNGGTA